MHSFFNKKFDQDGSVLIEFAFCCPILVIVLFFVLDVPLAYRVVMKMQKMSELTAIMIRNVPSKSDALISVEDLKNISKAAGITMTGKLGSSTSPCKRYPFFLSTYVFCIEGNSSGGFNKKWNVHIMNNLYNGEITPILNDSSLTYSKFKEVSDFNTINEFSNYAIREGEVKLIIETVAWYNESISATQEGVSGNSGGGGSGMFGDYNKNKNSVRGFNKGFYLMTIPGRSVATGEKAFGNKYAIMSCVDDIIDPEECPK